MSKIEWLARPGTKPESWNMIGGCTPVSPGCANCYAARMAVRLKNHPRYTGVAEMHNGRARWTGQINLDFAELDKPSGWTKPRTVFPCSMSDLFHEDVPRRLIEDVFKAALNTPRHTYMVLTKRPRRMAALQPGLQGGAILPNAWLGVTVENQAAADARRVHFRAIIAAVKFVSYEPALGSIDWSGWEFIDMLIFGGESGLGARPAHPNWFRTALAWCRENDIAPFFKQWGAWLHRSQLGGEIGFPDATDMHCWTNNLDASFRVGKKAAGHLLDGQVIREWPLPAGNKR